MFLKFLLWLISKLNDSQLNQLRNFYLISGPFIHDRSVDQSRITSLQSRVIGLERELEAARTSPAPVPEPLTEVFSRMNYEVYEYFERTVSNTSVASSTTDLEAGFKLGVQHVLAKLRNGYVTPRSL